MHNPLLCGVVPLHGTSRGGPERMGPRPPPWVPSLKIRLVVAVSCPPG